jgi:hypothetical protein
LLRPEALGITLAAASIALSLAANAGAQAFVPGDVNGDGAVDIVDATVLRRHLADLGPGISQTCGACLPAEEHQGQACDDGLFCTVGESCSLGACVATATRSCADASACTLDACDESARVCTNELLTGPVCDDGLFCTVGDACNAGTCVGVARDCSAAANSCSLAACDETGDVCASIPTNEGGACDDGLFCSVSDACTAGTCTGALRDCSDASACTLDLCDETADACAHPPLAIDPASLVASSSTDGSPLDACLVAGSGARLLVWTDLRDLAGRPASAVTVTIGGGAAVESATQPGVYYREVVAATEVGQTLVTVEATGCAAAVTLTASIAIDHVAANGSDGGTGGCVGPGGNVRVRVIAAETGLPLAGASVLLGDADGAGLEHSPDARFGGTPAPASQAATTDAAGFASFHDYGALLAGPITVTAGAAGRAYFSVIETAASDLVLALPLLHPPAPPASPFGAGTASSTTTWPPTGCTDVDLGLVLPQLALDDLVPLDVGSLFSSQRCWDAMNELVGTVSMPGNVYLPTQSIGPFCLGGSLAEARWSLTVPDSPPTQSLAMLLTSLPYSETQSTFASGGYGDFFLAGTLRRIGFLLDQTVSGPVSGANFSMNETYPNNLVVTYSGVPPETDVVGATAGDYAGTNGSGPLFLMGTATHAWDAPGTSLTLANSDLNAVGAPTSARRLATVSARYLDPSGSGRTQPPPPERRNAATTVLIRGDALPPFGGSGGTATVGSFLDLAAATFSAPASFHWEDASANGNAPLYSVHALAIREDQHLPVLSSCQTTNEVRPARSVQWIVAKRFGADCAADECFTLPVLPGSFPRAGSGPAQKSGFEALIGSGAACATTCALAGEACVDPDGVGPKSLQCMGGTGTAQQPHFTQAYEWSLGIHDLELMPGPFDFDSFRFGDREAYLTHTSSNRMPFD